MNPPIKPQPTPARQLIDQYFDQWRREKQVPPIHEFEKIMENIEQKCKESK